MSEHHNLIHNQVNNKFENIVSDLHDCYNKLFADIAILQQQINIINQTIEKIQIMLHDDGK